MIAGPFGTSSKLACQWMFGAPDSAAFCFSLSAGLISIRWTLSA